MKIKEINIASFGGLKNVKINPSSGLNVFYGENERGKSTVMAFIKMVFYGNGRNNADISKNMRKKYTPWDGSQMAGSIDFEHEGRNYRIERVFKKTDSGDMVILHDLDLGTRTNNVESDVGKRFFSLGADGFERTVFIGQFGFPKGDPDGEIGKRLSNIALTGDEDVSFEKVNERLLKAKTTLTSKSGTAGVYDKNLKTIENLKLELQRSAEAHETYGAVKEKLKETKNEILKMQAAAKELKEKISAEQDVRNAEKLKQLLELKAELDELNGKCKLSDGTLADESFLKKVQFCINKADGSAAKLSEIKKEIEILTTSIADIEATSREEKEAQKGETESKIAQTEQKRADINTRLKSAKESESRLIMALSQAESFKKKANPLLLIVGALILAAGLGVAFAVSLGIGLAVAAAGAVAAILGFVIRPTDKAKMENCRADLEKARKEISDLEVDNTDALAELTVLKTRLETISSALSGSTQLLEGNKKRLLDCKEQLPPLESEAQNDKQVLSELLGRYKKDFSFDEIEQIMTEISQNAAKQKEIKQQINYVLKDVGNISYEEAAEKLKTISDKTDITTDFDKVKAEYEKLASEISDKRVSMSEILSRAENSLSGIRNPEDIRKQISELSATAANQKAYCDRIDLATEILLDSNIEVRRCYGSELEKTAAEILERLTDGKYNSMSVSKNLDVAVCEAENFGTREIDYLSSGTADQAYLSLRLAISSLMSKESELLPIVMDDALAQYDDKRMKTALEFLNDYSKENQTIIFTCHKDISDYAKTLGANIL